MGFDAANCRPSAPFVFGRALFVCCPACWPAPDLRVPLTSLGSIQTLDHPITHSPPDLAQTPTLPASHRHSDSCLPQSTICSSYHLIHHLSDLPCLLSLPDPHLSSKPLCNVKGYALDECSLLSTPQVITPGRVPPSLLYRLDDDRSLRHSSPSPGDPR
jgi:hypothetical protein